MANLSFVSCILFLLFIIAFTGNNVMVIMVSGEDCHEDLGVCDADCFARCKAAHPKGRGSCVGPQICRCLFDQCKTCSEQLGRAGSCELGRCKADCAAKHPNRKAVGSCYSVGAPYSNCMCDYDCW